MKNRVYRTQAIVLRRSDLGEADRLLMLGTPAGKRTVIAKGVRKTTSRLAGHIELFSHTTLMLAMGRNLDVVTQSQVLNSFNTVRSDLSRLSYAYYITELYDLFTHEEENQQLFSLLLQAFQALDTTGNADLILRSFELWLLHYTGYRPHLQHCAVCHALLTEQANRFSPSQGGVLCPQHAQVDRAALPMSLHAFKVLRHLQRTPLETAARLNVSEAVLQETEQLLRAALYHIIERTLKSVAFIESLRAYEHRSSEAADSPPTPRLQELPHGLH